MPFIVFEHDEENMNIFGTFTKREDAEKKRLLVKGPNCDPEIREVELDEKLPDTPIGEKWTATIGSENFQNFKVKREIAVIKNRFGCSYDQVVLVVWTFNGITHLQDLLVEIEVKAKTTSFSNIIIEINRKAEEMETTNQS